MTCRWIVCVTLLTLLLLGDCLFAGDGCIAEEDRPGACTLLSECQPLVVEIQRAGAPMPSHVRRKLQALACGFQYDEPLVCCSTPFTNNEPNPGGDTIPPSPTHGMGVVTPWSTEPSTRPSENPNDHRHTPARSNPHGGPPDVQNHRNLRMLPTNCGVVESDRIWGGNRTRLFEMPWMVLISYDSPRGPKLSCGGTLITERYVLTAAHCVSFLGNRLTLKGVVLGEYDVRKDPDCERVEGELHCAPNIRNVSIERVISHPGYTPQTLFDDIGLIKLAEPADFNLDSMKPLCLPSTPQLQKEALEGVSAAVAGWGATEDGLQSPVLLSVDLPVVGNKNCQDAYNGTPQIYERQLCAGGVPEKDSCGGDSGGPLMYPGRISSGTLRYVQRGIISYGSKRCGLGGFPGVYTRVSHYMDWILDNIGN